MKHKQDIKRDNLKTIVMPPKVVRLAHISGEVE
jgi:hypothetical protein